MGPRVTALLGPTNTGKTFLAVERMLEHRTGVIGFPLRLLARENYDKIVKRVGRDEVALVTGEEKIVPRAARYFVCTVESMPLDRDFDFLAVDEIQLCADRERGHVFTDRLLFARGTVETMFLGADTIRRIVKELVPATELEARPRFSVLSATGPKKLVKLPPRTAVVAFSVAEVYATAELMRRHKGGAAVVLGALSPRTRNAQVQMYQEGQIDYLVATDAIGMGLNMDVDHVAFAALSKFDGETSRELTAAELAQIAGRAGRFLKDGTFGTTSDARAIDPATVEQIEQHRFPPLQAVVWRNSDLDFRSIEHLLASLDETPPHDALVKGRVVDDVHALRALWATPFVRRVAQDEDAVRLLWQVCQVPDFRKISPEEHARILAELFEHLAGPRAALPQGYVAAQLRPLDHAACEVEDLVARIARVRTWSYVAFRADWTIDPAAAQATAREVEDRLSDALHDRLTARFVDRLSSAMRRSRKSGEALAAVLDDDGAVTVEGAALGRLQGFRFETKEAPREEARLFGKAAAQALRQRLVVRAAELVADDDGAFRLGADCAITWRDEPVARLARGRDALSPTVEALPTTLLDTADLERVRARAQLFVARTIAARLGPLTALVAMDLQGAARGVAYQLGSALGAVPRRQVATLLQACTTDAKKQLAAAGVRLGLTHLYFTALGKPASVVVRAALWTAHAGHLPAPAPPPDGSVSFPRDPAVPDAFYAACGYEPIGGRAYRVDMLDRTAIEVKKLAKAGPFAPTPALLSWLGASPDDLAAVMDSLGFAADDEGRFAVHRRGSPRRAAQSARRGRSSSPINPLGDALTKR